MASGLLPTIFEEKQPQPGEDTSDFYDTDLECDDGHTSTTVRNERDKHSSEDMSTVGKQLYIQSCNTSNKNWYKPQVVPQNKVMDSLETRTINLQYRSLGSSHMVPLSKSLKNNMRVERLILDGCDIQGDGMKYLAEGLVDNVTVNYLDLSNNSLGIEGAKWAAYLLLKNKFIKHVILSGNKFGEETAKYIGAVIEVNDSITYLDLSHNEFREKSGQVIGAALGENFRIETLRLGWNSLRNQGAIAIGQSLAYNDTLKVLDVNMNGFGYGGCLALRVSLKTNTTLRELDLTNNSINWNGAQLIAHGLQDNTGLQVLRIGRNSLTTTGCMDLVAAASHSTSSLTFLDLQDISILQEANILAEAINQHREFKIRHGGIVGSPDRLGQREDKDADNMSKLLLFIKESMIRPLELLRDFDKTTSNFVSEEEFVNRMEKVGVPLHKFQMRELAKEVRSDTTGIDYKKLADAVTEHIIRDRLRIYKEQQEKRRLRTYNENLLEGGLPALDLTGSKGYGRKSKLNQIGSQSKLSNKSEDILKEVQSVTVTSFPNIFDKLIVGKITKSENDNVLESPKSPKNTLLLSSPLKEHTQSLNVQNLTSDPQSSINLNMEVKKPKKRKLRRKRSSSVHPVGGTCVQLYS